MTKRLILCLLLALPAGAAAAGTTVRYAPAGPVSSFEYRNAAERDALYREIARLLIRLGDRELPAGRTLSVELLDVRPAGRLEPWLATAGQVRVAREVTPPSVKLRYALKERGRTLAAGEETVTDLNYLSNVSARLSPSSFPYERELMRDWFRNRIVRLRPPPR